MLERSRRPLLVALLLVAALAAVARAEAAPPAGVSCRADQDPAYVGEPVQFSATSTDPGATFSWDFGAVGPVAKHAAYSSPGPQTVTVIATGIDGPASASCTVTIVVNRPPVAGIRVNPTQALPGETVLLDATGSSDPNGDTLSYTWDLDGDGTFGDATGATTTTSFLALGVHTVRVRVDDGHGKTDVGTATIVVLAPPPAGDVAPKAAITVSDAQPLTRQRVTFAARDSDPDGVIVRRAWDLDGDGRFDDGTGATAEHSYASTGPHTATLLVTDDAGATTVARATITVRNRPPVASFRISPERARTGQTVTLRSTSLDPDGTVSAQRWDLNGDGRFDDARSAVVRAVFRQPGTHQIGLLVRDDSGATGTAFGTVEVVTPPQPRTLMLRPFPVVRIAGLVYRWGAQFRTFTVSAPRGASVFVRCHGRRCPRRTWSATSTGRLLHVRPFERALAAGVMLEVRVTKQGWIGKYARITVAASKPPRRHDACLRPGRSAPSACRG